MFIFRKKINKEEKKENTLPSHHSQILKRKEWLRYEQKLYSKSDLPKMYHLLYLLYEGLLESGKYERERQELLKVMKQYNNQTRITYKELHNLADVLARTLKLDI